MFFWGWAYKKADTNSKKLRLIANLKVKKPVIACMIEKAIEDKQTWLA